MGICNCNLFGPLLIRQEILRRGWHLISQVVTGQKLFCAVCCHLEYAEVNLCPRFIIRKHFCELVFNSHQDTFLKCSTAELISAHKTSTNAVTWCASRDLFHCFIITQIFYVKIPDFYYVNEVHWRTINKYVLKWLKYILSVWFSKLLNFREKCQSNFTILPGRY